MKKAPTSWIFTYWLNLLSLVLIALYFLLIKGIKGKSITEDDFTYERLGIIFTLIIIPLVLKFYHNRHQKALEKESLEYFPQMSKFFYLRLILIDFTIIFNLICFYNIGAMNFFYLVLIGLFSFFLCYPSSDNSLK